MNLKLNGDPLPKISISIGIAGFPDHGSAETLEELIKKADTALRRAKETGRNRTVVYHHANDPEKIAPLLPGIAEEAGTGEGNKHFHQWKDSGNGAILPS